MIDSQRVDRSADFARLSPREAEVLGIAARGATNGEIAHQLSISVHAVKFHLAAVYRKLEVSNRTEAAVLYLRGDSLSAVVPVPAPAVES